jgi:hypothetical protein
MKNKCLKMKCLSSILLLLFSFGIKAQLDLKFQNPVNQRLFVLTDITNEPDDQESMVRLLVYANEYDLEGIIATTSTHLRNQTRKDKIEKLVRDYGLVRPILEKHAQGFPTLEYLLGIVAEHLPVFSMEGVGEGKDSPGSELLIQSVDKADERPLWVSVWGGANCLAQALWKVKATRGDADVQKFVSKLKVYSISDQDFAGQWIRNNFPGIFYIVDASAGDSWFEYYKATWTGISGDRFYRNGPGVHQQLVDNKWLAANIRENHGPLGSNYLKFDYIMEGDTPSFFGLINSGLGWYISPAFGGWGGRYELYRSYAEKEKIWTSSVNTQDEILLSNGQKYASNQATIWRWREAYQNDFAARMDWNVLESFKNANHNPVLNINGNSGKSVGYAAVKKGQKVLLSAKGSSDPDGDKLSYHWFIYREAGGFRGNCELKNPISEEIEFEMPELKDNETLHVILEVKDSGSPNLFSYRRVVFTNRVN